MEKHYYDFGYFFGSKDSGSILIATDKELNVDDIDESVSYVFKQGLIDEEYIENIIYIEELSKEEYLEMGGKDI